MKRIPIEPNPYDEYDRDLADRWSAIQTDAKFCSYCAHEKIDHFDDGAGTTGCNGVIWEEENIYNCDCKGFLP